MSKNKTIHKTQTLALPNSIIGRLILATFILLPIFCGLLGFSLDKAFTSSLLKSEKEQLTLQAYSLIASAEFEQDTLWFPEQFTDDRLNQASSNLFATIISSGTGNSIWRSNSATNIEVPSSWQTQKIAPGQSTFGEASNLEEELFYLQYHVVWEGEQAVEHSFQFVIFERQDKVKEQIATYRQSLWGWLSAIALSITLVQIVILKWGLKPINRVSHDLRQIQQGKQGELNGPYPMELEEMTDSINILLSNEAKQRLRYKNTLSNLAHSLKTPLAIMQGSLKSNDGNQQTELEEQLKRVDQIVTYQLKKTISAPLNPFSNNVLIRENCQKVVSALQKVYLDKQTKVEIDIPADLAFKGDKGDLLEILGNIIDNAFKYGQGKIRIVGTQLDGSEISLIVEDNGCGIKEDQRTEMLRRGERADTSISGQGIGLAVVTDIVSHYQGSIELGVSELGGLRLKINL